jgi:uncharacterized repeat protein (TIGR02543 family)
MAKLFEVGDVLPATTQLKISWSSDDGTAFYSDCDNLVIKTDNNNYRFINYVRNDWEKSGDFGFLGDEYEVIYKVFGGDDINDGFGEWYGTYGVDKFCIIDISALTEAQRTVSFYSNLRYNDYYWEDLNAPSGYTITFETNGGSNISDIEDATELPTPLPTPTKSGYTFVNWYYDSAFTQKATAGDTLESNVTLYAKWHNLGSLFTEIANAIREKESSSGTIRDVDFGERIKQIQAPTLNAPSISISDNILTITPNSNNGNFVTDYKIFADGILLGTTTSITVDLSAYELEDGTYVITVKACGKGFNDSLASNSQNYTIDNSTHTLTFGTITYTGTGSGGFRLKVNTAPSNLSDYEARHVKGNSNWTNSSGSVVNSILNVSKFYIFVAFPDANDNYFYQVNNGEWVQHMGSGFAEYHEVNLSGNSTLNIKIEPKS